MNRALIVEDHPETQTWLDEIVRAAFPRCETDRAETLRRGLELAESGDYNLALIDLGLPDGSGLGVVRRFRAQSASTVCVVTTVMGDDANIVTALSAGAEGYLLKDQPTALITHQLAQIAAGIPALSPPVARRIMEHFRLTGPCEESKVRLTGREQEVLCLIARGLRIADAANALGVAESTVASHVKAVYRKLGISTRAEAALHAARLGLLEQQPK